MSLSHADLCELSRVFNYMADLRDPQHLRINEALKAELEASYGRTERPRKGRKLKYVGAESFSCDKCGFTIDGDGRESTSMECPNCAEELGLDPNFTDVIVKASWKSSNRPTVVVIGPAGVAKLKSEFLDWSDPAGPRPTTKFGPIESWRITDFGVAEDSAIAGLGFEFGYTDGIPSLDPKSEHYVGHTTARQLGAPCLCDDKRHLGQGVRWHVDCPYHGR